MPRKVRQLKADLRRAGASIVRQRGSHTTWQHPAVPGVLVELAGQDGDDARPYQERDIRDALRRIVEAHEGDRT
jgi:predicted RNA binding protein YcfA (HicA-like mRNA interferase family)